MIDIIILIFLCQKIGAKAAYKGLSSGWWKFYTVMAWLGAEFIGAIIAVLILGQANVLSLNGYLIIVICAFGGYLLIKYLVEKAPSKIDDIDDFGKDVEPE